MFTASCLGMHGQALIRRFQFSFVETMSSPPARARMLKTAEINQNGYRIFWEFHNTTDLIRISEDTVSIIPTFPVLAIGKIGNFLFCVAEEFVHGRI